MVVNYEQLLRAVFSCFHGQKFRASCFVFIVKSVYPLLLPLVSLAGTNFYGTENVIWAGFGPIGNTEKKVWANY